MSAVITLPHGVDLCHLPSPFVLSCGAELRGAVVAHARCGVADGPVVVVLGGISADRHPDHWWRGVVGDDLAIDTRRFSVLSIDWLGGAGCSTSPGRGESFPFVSTTDQADALAAVLDSLRIDAVHALVGASYGGMVGLSFAARHGDRLERLCAIAAADASHPQASAWRAVQRAIVQLGQRSGVAQESLALARALAMTTYRTPDELGERFAGPPAFSDGEARLAVADWLRARGAAFAERFLAEQFLCLNASIDAHCVDPHDVTSPTTLVAFTSDQLVPAADVRRLAGALPRLARHIELPTRFGHDGFLKEPVALGAAIAEVLR
ncbi:MAG: homoserine O-succinyltransferase [Planctomycetes bacterium]|nr:homoserine O-succinyltransferase [Planctomycetota bacterium]